MFCCHRNAAPDLSDWADLIGLALRACMSIETERDNWYRGCAIVFTRMPSMTTPESRLNALGLHLPQPTSVPDGVPIPFSFVNVRGDRATISGHAKSAMDGRIVGPFGVVGDDITTEQAYDHARAIGLNVLANLKAEIGDLSRVVGWMRVFGMVTSAPNYTEQHLVINGFSDLILDVFGPDIGRHSRSAIGVPSLPMGFAMEIEGEVLIKP